MGPKPKRGSKPKRAPSGNKKKLTVKTPAKRNKSKRQCGLCGKTRKLTKTECCNNWICDDYDKYVMFSFARNSCNRNHDRYTLCSSHHIEKHEGKWQDCEKCKEGCDTPNYVWYGTNKYNFEVLQNPEKVSVSCFNCGFTADTIDAFPVQSSSSLGRRYYCAKEQCQKVALAPKENKD